MNSVLLTGASGFIGKKVTTSLINKKYNVRVVLRKKDTSIPTGCKACFMEGMNKTVNWARALRDVDLVVHLAARVHHENNGMSDCLSEFRKINVEGTINLAQQAAREGVKRFLFLSSVKVTGELTDNGSSFSEKDAVNPNGPYAISKWEAEQGLVEIANRTGLEVVIIRPPLVYGPHVKGNFFRLMRLLDSGIPLPFGAIKNKRSFIFLDNLVDLIVHSLEHPKAGNQIFFAADEEDMSTTELLHKLSVAMGKTPHLIPVPQKLLEIALVSLGKRHLAHRLCGSLTVDMGKTRELLAWKPPFNVEYGLKETALWYQRNKRRLIRGVQ